MKSTTDSSSQNDINDKIVTGLERISEAFKSLLWDYAKKIGLSPIQIRILIFIERHKEDLCTISYLSKEFNLTKPTVSDAVKTLEKKKLISKHTTSTDNRSYSIRLTLEGARYVNETKNFADPIKAHISSFNKDQQESLLKTINVLIYKLNQSGVLSVQRTCYGCKFYEINDEVHYCNLIDSKLKDVEIRLDCPEFEEKK